MKIIVWYECYFAGGADWSLIDLISSWPDKKDTFLIYINKTHEGLNLVKVKTKDFAEVRTFSSALELKNHVVQSRWMCWVPAKLKRIVKYLISFITLLFVLVLYQSFLSRRNCDILLMNNGGYPGGLTNYIIALIAKMKKISKRFMIVRNYPCTRENIIMPILRVICHITMTRIITVSDSLKWAMIKDAKIKNDLIKTIHNGTAIKNKLPGSHDPLLKETMKNGLSLGIIGVLQERKGHSLLFKAWSQVLKVYPDAKLFIVGSSKCGDKNKLVRLAEKLNITESLVWCEFIQDIGEIYANLDVVVMPSQELESFGRVAIEAMAFQKPIVASRVCGLPEVINHNEDGFLFEKNDDKELARIIIKLFSSRDLRQKVGRKGFERYNENFKAEIMSRNYRELFVNN